MEATNGTPEPAEPPVRVCPDCGAAPAEGDAGWCPRCGAALDGGGAGWDVAAPAPGRGAGEAGGAHADPHLDPVHDRLHQASAGEPLLPEPIADPGPGRASVWLAGLRSRPGRLPLLVVTVVVIAALGVGAFFIVRANTPAALALFPVAFVDEEGHATLGYIDRHGAMKIEPQVLFETTDSRFSEGLAAVMKDGKACFIDTTGAVVIKTQYDGASGFHEGVARLWAGSGCAYIDRNGDFVVPPGVYADGRDFSEGLAAVMVQNGASTKFGFIDRTGKLVIKAQFDYVGDFSGGLAAAQVPGFDRPLWGFIDRQGDWAIPPQFEGGMDFSEGLAAVAGPTTDGAGNWGYIDEKGAWVIEPRFVSVSRFSEGLAAAAEADGSGGIARIGYIDTTGAWVIEPRFGLAGDFSHGLAPAMESTGDGLWGYVDRAGAWVIRPQFDGAGSFGPEGLATVWTHDDVDTRSWAPPSAAASSSSAPIGTGYESSGLTGYIDTTGRIIWMGPHVLPVFQMSAPPWVPEVPDTSEPAT